MNRITALAALALTTLALASGCSGADAVTRPPGGCSSWDDDYVEKNGPCEPCDKLRSGPGSRDKNKPCIPEEPPASPADGAQLPPVS